MYICLLCFCSCDKTTTLRAKWNLQSVFINDEPVIDSDEYHLQLFITNYYFYVANSFNITTLVDEQVCGAPNGFYNYNYVNKTIEMKFTIRDQRSEIMAKIKKLSQKEMRLEYEKDGNIYLLKLFSN